ncbi:toxin VasX [Halomonas sp. A29]|uniref:toxin VasX n=1 Tax=Halomonas sp. A29 TaxID=3102786 RepID=UPI00398A61C4
MQQGIDALLLPLREEEFTCASNPDHHYSGRCLTIPNADQAGDIYLAFSDTAWTKRVWHEHATNAAVGSGGLRRRDHMRKLSLAAWRGGSADHAAPLAELQERFAEAVILTPADRQEMTRLRWRQLLPTEAGLGVVAGILQIIALGKLAR